MVMLKHYTGCCDQSVVFRIIVEVIISYPDWPGLNMSTWLVNSPSSKGFSYKFLLPELSQAGPDTGPGPGSEEWSEDHLTSWLEPSTLCWY